MWRGPVSRLCIAELGQVFPSACLPFGRVRRGSLLLVYSCRCFVALISRSYHSTGCEGGVRAALTSHQRMTIFEHPSVKFLHNPGPSRASFARACTRNIIASQHSSLSV